MEVTYQAPFGTQFLSDTILYSRRRLYCEIRLFAVYGNVPYFKQITNLNRSQAIGVSVECAHHERKQAKTNYERAMLNVENASSSYVQITSHCSSNNITAYSNAVSALEKYQPPQRRAKPNMHWNLVQKIRIGILSTIDYITIQTNLFTAKSNQVSAKYDYVFKMKVLEFYKGQGLSVLKTWCKLMLL
jgi:outer membrane protein